MKEAIRKETWSASRVRYFQRKTEERSSKYHERPKPQILTRYKINRR